MKKIQILALIMSVVTFLSLVGVGFSIWYNLDVKLPNDDGVVTGDGNVITAYAVDRSSEILKCQGEIGMFQYSALSFVGGDEGTITATYSIDTSKTDILKDSTQLTFSLTTEENTTRDNTGLFGAVDDTSMDFSVSATIGSVDLGTANVSNDGKTISFTCTYGDIENQIADGTFTLTYTLEIPEKYDKGNGAVGNFRKAFGQYLLSNKVNDDGSTTTTTFVVIAEVTIS